MLSLQVDDFEDTISYKEAKNKTEAITMFNRAIEFTPSEKYRKNWKEILNQIQKDKKR